MSWSRSAGHVDWYHVTLEDSASGISRSTMVSGTAAPQSGFSSLVPGGRYVVGVVASSGKKNATRVHTAAATGGEKVLFAVFLCIWTLRLWFSIHPLTHLPAPSPVRRLQVAPSSSQGLLVFWLTGPGRAERVWVLLADQDGALLRNVSLQSTTTTSVLLDHLQPGTSYTVTVVTEAAGLQSPASMQALTGDLVLRELSSLSRR